MIRTARSAAAQGRIARHRLERLQCHVGDVVPLKLPAIGDGGQSEGVDDRVHRGQIRRRTGRVQLEL